jgi:nicotinate phosphoribosyltransferase
VISFGARHVHPDVTDVLDYAAIVGGCVGASTPAGARLANLNPTGTMPHSLVLIVGDTLRAAQAFDRDLEPDVPRIVLVDTFKDEAEEALRVADALGDKLYGIRLDTPSERGRVRPFVKEIRRASPGWLRRGEDRRLRRPDARPDPPFKGRSPADSFAVGAGTSGEPSTSRRHRDDGSRSRRGRYRGSRSGPTAAGGSRRLAERH